MRKLLLLLLILSAYPLQLFAYPMPKPFPPFRIAGNLYYVGTDDLASYLVVTDKGNILINSCLEANVPMIKASIEKLGFKYSDTKILLVNHAHLDHAGGSALIKQQTGTQYWAMTGDVREIESGGKTDFHYSNDAEMYFPATKVDKVLHDGDIVTLGDTTVTAHLTAGHTKGNTSWSLPVMENGKLYQAVIVGSLNVNPGYKLVNNAAYPTITQDFAQAIAKLKSLKADIFLGAHAGYFDLEKKYAQLGKSAVNPFVDAAGYRQHIAQKEREFMEERGRQNI